MNNNENSENLKMNIISIGRLLWEKDLVSGLNGNISRRLDEETVLLTAHGSCLGILNANLDNFEYKIDTEISIPNVKYISYIIEK